MIESTYSSVLTRDSPIFARTDCKTSNYYYEAIRMEIVQSGCYNLIGNSSIDVYGQDYKDQFNPLFPMHDLFAEDGRTYRDGHFELQTSLLNNTKYILVVTTFHQNITGTLSVLVTGPNSVNLNRISEYFYLLKMKIMLEKHVTNILLYSDYLPSVIQSTYLSALATNSQKYGRRDCERSHYYYEAIQVKIVTSGLYTFTSDSKIDLYGYFYKDYFNPLNPSENNLFQDDDGCRHGQFKVIVNLQSSTSYVLVVTTFSQQTTSQFMISAFGPNIITFKNSSKSIPYEPSNKITLQCSNFN